MQHRYIIFIVFFVCSGVQYIQSSLTWKYRDNSRKVLNLKDLLDFALLVYAQNLIMAVGWKFLSLEDEPGFEKVASSYKKKLQKINIYNNNLLCKDRS